MSPHASVVRYDTLVTSKVHFLLRSNQDSLLGMLQGRSVRRVWSDIC